MKLVLITGEDCGICQAAEEKFKKSYSHELKKGEAVITDIDIDENMQRLWMKQDYPVPPVIAIVTDENRLITVVDAEEFLADQEKASPAGAPADKVAAESSG